MTIYNHVFENYKTDNKANFHSNLLKKIKKHIIDLYKQQKQQQYTLFSYVVNAGRQLHKILKCYFEQNNIQKYCFIKTE